MQIMSFRVGAYLTMLCSVVVPSRSILMFVSLCNEQEEPAESFIWMLKIEAIEEDESVFVNRGNACCMSGET